MEINIKELIQKLKAKEEQIKLLLFQLEYYEKKYGKLDPKDYLK